MFLWPVLNYGEGKLDKTVRETILEFRYPRAVVRQYVGYAAMIDASLAEKLSSVTPQHQ